MYNFEPWKYTGAGCLIFPRFFKKFGIMRTCIKNVPDWLIVDISNIFEIAVYEFEESSDTISFQFIIVDNNFL